FFLDTSPHPPTSTLLPYTTLFRSPTRRACAHYCCSCRAPREFAGGDQLRCPSAEEVEKKKLTMRLRRNRRGLQGAVGVIAGAFRSEEHTSELQSRGHLVCRLLLEK